jgi:amidase
VSLLHELSAQELVVARKSGELSARELTEHFLDRIDAHNPELNAIVTLAEDSARARANSMDNAHIPPGLLWGLPFVDKDLHNRAGVRTGCGSKTKNDSPPATESDPLPQALDDAGGISLGKSAVCEFGLSSYTESDVFGPTRSPYAPEHGAGGSSGGAASAVAAGMVPVAPGNDGGGSVRIPAWSCGVVGIKPSRGLVPSGTGFDSLGGLVVPGPLARSVGDAALLLDAMIGNGVTYRATGHARPTSSFLQQAHEPTAALTIAVVEKSPWDSGVPIAVDPAASAVVQQVARVAENLGHHVEHYDWIPPRGYGEAFHGVWSSVTVLLDVPPHKRDDLESLTRYLLEVGERQPASVLAGALLALARFETEVIRQFSAYDVVLTPGLATLPPKIGFYDREDPERNFLQQVQVTPFTSFVNVCGLPAVALPVTQTPEGLPLGVQLIGGPGQDGLLVSLSAQLEAELGWLGTRPRIW